jgi:heme exporter protein A
MTVLIADRLQLWRGERHVLRDVSFTLAAGQCLQLTGANGAGKTTLLRCLCGLLPAESGAVRWRGVSLAEDRYALHAELAYLGHDNGLKADLSAGENLRYAIGMRRTLAAREIAEALERVGVGDARLLRHLSAGQRRRVALARVWLLKSALWLLDEPGAHLDSAGQQVLLELLRQHLTEGGSAVVATHQPLGLAAGQFKELKLS